MKETACAAELSYDFPDNVVHIQFEVPQFFWAIELQFKRNETLLQQIKNMQYIFRQV